MNDITRLGFMLRSKEIHFHIDGGLSFPFLFVSFLLISTNAIKFSQFHFLFKNETFSISSHTTTYLFTLFVNSNWKMWLNISCQFVQTKYSLFTPQWEIDISCQL